MLSVLERQIVSSLQNAVHDTDPGIFDGISTAEGYAAHYCKNFA